MAVLHMDGTIEALVKVIEDKPSAMFGQYGNACEFFAVQCMAHMSEEPLAHESLSRALKLLTRMISDDGDYTDRPMRREAARAVRNMAGRNPHQFIQQLGSESLREWYRATSTTLLDPEMQTDVEFAKQSLAAVGFTATVPCIDQSRTSLP